MPASHTHNHRLEINGVCFDASFHEVEEDGYSAIHSNEFEHVSHFDWVTGQTVQCRLLIEGTVDLRFACVPRVFDPDVYHQYGHGSTHAIGEVDHGDHPDFNPLHGPYVNVYFAWDGSTLDFVGARYVIYNGGS